MGDIEALSGIADLVFDYVINHGSSAHPRFSEFWKIELLGMHTLRPRMTART